VQQQEQKPKLVQSKSLPKYSLKLKPKAHLQGLVPMNLTRLLVHRSPLSDIECPVFPTSFMSIGQSYQDAIQESIQDMRELKRHLRKRLFK
jgi:hypothetical protein